MKAKSKDYAGQSRRIAASLDCTFWSGTHVLKKDAKGHYRCPECNALMVEIAVNEQELFDTKDFRKDRAIQMFCFRKCFKSHAHARRSFRQHRGLASSITHLRLVR